MLEGRFLCILLGCIEIMYFLEDLVVCKFEITGLRLGTWVQRWEASRKCSVRRWNLPAGERAIGSRLVPRSMAGEGGVRAQREAKFSDRVYNVFSKRLFSLVCLV